MVLVLVSDLKKVFLTQRHFGHANLVSSGRHPVELGGGVSVRPALQCDWLLGGDVHGGWEGVRRDVRQAAVGPATLGPAPTDRHHFLQLPTNQVRWRGAEGDGGLQHLQM